MAAAAAWHENSGAASRWQRHQRKIAYVTLSYYYTGSGSVVTNGVLAGVWQARNSGG